MKVPETIQHPQVNAYLQQVVAPQRGEMEAQEAQAPGQAAGHGNVAPARRDVVEISPESRLAQEAENVGQAQEQARTQKVQALKEQVQNGTYEVNPVKVADAMMRDLIKNLG